MTVNRVGGEGWWGEGGWRWPWVGSGVEEEGERRGGVGEESGGEVYAGARRGGGGERVT